MGLFNNISSIFRGRDAPTNRTSGRDTSHKEVSLGHL